jgi:ABC-type sugar transport system permease subunit
MYDVEGGVQENLYPTTLKKMTSKEELAVKKKKGRLGLSNSFHYTLMVLPGYIWLFMFSIVPMVGIVMAFQDYNPSKGWFGSPWVGLKWFKYLTVIPDAKRALVNTLIIAIAKVILNIIIPLVFALLLNEVKNMKFKKTVQTIVYLPHFVSWVILANIITNIHRRKAQKKRLSVSLQKASFRVFHYSFTAPSVIPVTKYFCRNGYTISIGTRAINTFAASSDLLEFCANC